MVWVVPPTWESPISLPSRTIWQCHRKDMSLKSQIIKLSNKMKGQDFYGHMYKCDAQGTPKPLFPYMQPSLRPLFLVSHTVWSCTVLILLSENTLKVPPRHRHTYWHKRWRHRLWNPRTSVLSTWNQALEPPRAWRQRTHRECLHKPCFHRKPG